MDYTPAGKAQESTVVHADHIVDFYIDYMKARECVLFAFRPPM